MLVAPVLFEPGATAQVYRCESGDGVPVYQGNPSGTNCRRVDLQPLTTIPAPKAPAGASGTAAGAGKPAAGSSRSASPASFPRVDGTTQRARDAARRNILEEELRKERLRLEALQAEYKDGQPDRLGNERNYQRYLDRVESLKADIDRAEANIGSLERELAAIRE
ncbi:MAG: DUF4124 domain-containing protein [Burkholderiaceae bacterium]